MGTIRKRGKKWTAEVCVDRLRKSKTFVNKREAQKWIIETELNGVLNDTSSLKQIVARYIKEVTPTHKGRKQEKYRLHLLVDELPDKPLHKFTPNDFSIWKQEKLKTVSPPTVRRYMTALNSVFNHAIAEWQVMDKNPLQGVKKPPSNPHRERYPTDQEVKEIVRELGNTGKSKQIGITLLLALETAMRAGEILSLNRSNVDYKNRVATLTNTKNGDTREVPLSTKAIQLLKSVDPEYFTVSSAVHSQLFRRAVRNCGIDNLRFHDSRAAGLMRLSKKVDVLSLARIVGMRSPNTLMIYYRETAAELSKLLD